MATVTLPNNFAVQILSSNRYDVPRLTSVHCDSPVQRRQTGKTLEWNLVIANVELLVRCTINHKETAKWARINLEKFVIYCH